MNYTKDKLLKVARHWEGLSLNERLAGKDPTPMITIEMPVVVWDKIWEEDAAPKMRGALSGIDTWLLANPNISNDPQLHCIHIHIQEALAKAEGK